jgi:DNA ligase-1
MERQRLALVQYISKISLHLQTSLLNIVVLLSKVFSRSLLNTSEKFPEVPLYVQEACKETSVTSFVLDTEVVAFNRVTQQFVPFQVLSTRKKTEESAEDAKVKVIVQAFDLMYLNGESLLDRPLAERRELMRKNFIPVPGKFQ